MQLIKLQGCEECKLHTDNKLKSSIRAWVGGLPHVGFETLLRAEGGTWGGWVHLNTTLNFQHNTIRCIHTSLYHQSDKICHVDILLNHQYPHVRKVCLMTPLSLSITSASLCMGEHLRLVPTLI